MIQDTDRLIRLAESIYVASVAPVPWTDEDALKRYAENAFYAAEQFLKHVEERDRGWASFPPPRPKEPE